MRNSYVQTLNTVAYKTQKSNGSCFLLERERERERQRQRQRQRQTDRQTNRDRDRQTDRHKQRDRDRENVERERETDRQTPRQTDRQTDRHTETEREREPWRERERGNGKARTLIFGSIVPHNEKGNREASFWWHLLTCSLLSGSCCNYTSTAISCLTVCPLFRLFLL